MIEVDTVIAANRFGLGARPRELAEIGRDPRGWLASQIVAMTTVPSALRGLSTSPTIVRQYQAARQEIRLAGETPGTSNGAVKFQQVIKDLLQSAYRAQVAVRYRVAAETEAPFRERLVHFWTNHFAVSAEKPPVWGLAGTLENEAIRPRVTGRFIDLLLAVETHPAMLYSLDNQVSIGPNSEMASNARRRGHRLGINENLGREILELHTLGVNGGYSQADVTAFSNVLTGWSVGGREGWMRGGMPGQFYFRESAHEPGPKTLLRKTYRQSRVGQGEAVLRDLARHPATARHLATKLVRHFIADEPPSAAVEHVARTYQQTEGSLSAVYRALWEAPAAWEHPLQKFKTPHEFVISSIRALDIRPDQPRKAAKSLTLLGQPAYRPGSPAGWPDTAASWDGADALLKRIEWANVLARRVRRDVEPSAVSQSALGPVLSDHSRGAIARAESRVQALTLLLASPEFQRR